jgi:hypothetical protein
MADLPGVKTKYEQVIKCRWNCDGNHATERTPCMICYAQLRDFCEIAGYDVPNLNLNEFYVPMSWWLANEKLGCLHGRKKLLESAYVKNK